MTHHDTPATNTPLRNIQTILDAHFADRLLEGTLIDGVWLVLDRRPSPRVTLVQPLPIRVH
jgi:hypothetical protein